MSSYQRFLSTQAAADYLGLSRRTLEKFRCLGGGPKFHKLGRRVVYDRFSLDTWADARRRATTHKVADGV